MKVVVTGGAGRLGSHLSRVLVDVGHSVTSVDIAQPSRQQAGVTYVEGDLNDASLLRSAFSEASAVVHLAGYPTYDPGQHSRFIDHNYRGTFMALEAAAEVGADKFVFASSICAYGFIHWHERMTPDYFPIDEDHPCRPSDLYGLTKWQGEQLCRAYAWRYGVNATALRLATVWFPDYPDWTTRFLKRVDFPEQGIDSIWSYVDVRDVVNAFVLTLMGDHRSSFTCFNIGASDTASRLPTRELITRFYPDTPAIKGGIQLLQDDHAALYSIARAQEELGYKPKHTWREYVVADNGS